VTLVVLIGGARSGKSRLALDRATRQGAPVVFVATGEAGDEEMAERIERHRRERPADWQTVEEPVELGRALAAVPDGATAVVDCLSFWVANVFETQPVEELAAASARTAAARTGLTIAVTNEVGLAVVPANPLARRYRDVLGRVNSIWVEASDESYFVVAGRRMRLEEDR
jgi:adenosylcobinamide kinase / adenosylcobinamide-phosphate guanylyltransferase